MANISKITLPSGTTYNLKDAAGRALIATDYAKGQAYYSGDFVIYNDELYRVTADIKPEANTAWSDITQIKSTVGAEIKAFKGTISGAMSFIGITTSPLTDGSTLSPIDVENQGSVSPSAGSVVIRKDNNYEFVFDGTKWSELGRGNSFKALAFKDEATGTGNVTGGVTSTFSNGTISEGSTTVTPKGTIAKQDFTGTETPVSISYQPAGKTSISVVASDTSNNYTPAGTITKPSITVSPQTADLSTVTGVGALQGGTLPTFTAEMGENETLVLSFNQGAFPTQGKVETANKTIMTGATASMNDLSFNGTPVNITGSFVGTEATLETNIIPQGTVAQASFSGEASTGTVTGTVTGSVTSELKDAKVTITVK